MQPLLDNPASPSEEAAVLASLTVEANRGFGRMAEHQTRTLEEAHATGLVLLEIQKHLPPGVGWDEWREANLDCALNTARECERIAREWHKIGPLVDSGEVQSIRQALAAIRKPRRIIAFLPPKTAETSHGAVGEHPEESHILALPAQPERVFSDEPLAAPGESAAVVLPIQPLPTPGCFDAQRTLEDRILTLEAEKIARRRELDDVKTELLRAKDDLARTSRELREAQEEIKSLREKVTESEQSAQKEADMLRAINKSIQEDLEAARQELARANAQLRESDDKLAECDRLIRAQIEHIDKLQAETPAKGKKKQIPVAVIPPSLDTEAFREEWAKWAQFRCEIKKPLTPSMMEAQLDHMATIGEQRAIAMMKFTRRKGWQGLKEESEVEAQQPIFARPAQPPPAPEQRLPKITAPVRPRKAEGGS